MAGASALVALSLGGCQSGARQDAHAQDGSVCSFMAPTVSGTRNYVPRDAKEGPDSAIAYPDPETPVYCDRPIAESLRSAIELANYTRALQSVGLFNILEQGGPYTVFAIANGPLQRYEAQFSGGILQPANAPALKSLLGYTIVPGRWSVDALRKAIARQPTHAIGLHTLSGAILTVSPDPASGQLILSNGAGAVNRLWVTGIPQSNGVLYFTQSLLSPVFPQVAPAASSFAKSTQSVAAKPLAPLR
ncbi:fasciclin domain-containing protein [Acetobacter fallax]|uniref:fasciclin domain-containing protein n=1 Tax=Acetobacter fallax TaxID=1737473 RepID=UPI001886B6F8|nr:fasciclin domain-containing protein [Acetobacter fallax]